MKNISKKLKLILRILLILALFIIVVLFFMEHLSLLVALRFYEERVSRGDDVANVPLFVRLSGFNLLFAIVYFVISCVEVPLMRLILNIKINKKQYPIFYNLTVCLNAGVSIFIIYINLQYFSRDVIVSNFFEMSIVYIIMCNLLCLCFGIYVWRNFFDEVVLFVKNVVKKIKMKIN